MSSGTLRRAGQSMGGSARLGWNCKRDEYMCRDRREIGVPRKTANVRDLDETKTVPRNKILYRTSKRDTKAVASGVAFGRNMSTVFGAPDDVRTIILPKMARTVRQGSFCKVKPLRVAILNEGLEVLGTDEHRLDGKWYSGVF